MQENQNIKEKQYRRNQRARLFWSLLLVSSLLVILVAGVIIRQGDGNITAEAANQTVLSEENENDSKVAEDKEAEELAPSWAGQEAEPEADNTGEAAAGESKTDDTAATDTNDEEMSGENESEDAAEPGTEQEEALNEQASDVPMIALTFDDGPFTTVTNRILDVLEEHDAKATFFVVGSRIDFYSDTLKRIHETGNQVASHTWSHPDLNTLTAEEIISEIDRTEELLNEYIPVGSVMLRPPYGNASETVCATVPVPMINWSLDSEDWKSRDADAIIEQVLKNASDGDVVLMHDLYESTAEAVEYLVPELIRRGYKLVTVEELFTAKGIELSGGIVYREAIFVP